MTGEAFGRLFGFCVKFQNANHAFADFTGKSLVGAAMFVLQDPCGIFVLQDTAAGDGLNAAVATGGGAGARANIFHGLVGILGGGGNFPRNED